MQPLIRNPGVFAGHFHVQAAHCMALLLVGSGNGLFHAPVAQRQQIRQNRHIFKRDKVQAQNQLFPVVALVKAGEKAVIAPAFHRKIAGFEVKRPGRHSFQNFNRQIARDPGFGKHAVKIRVKTQDVLCWPPRAHDLQIIGREDLRLNGAFRQKPFRYRVPARKRHKNPPVPVVLLLVAHITVIINRFPDIGNF